MATLDTITSTTTYWVYPGTDVPYPGKSPTVVQGLGLSKSAFLSRPLPKSNPLDATGWRKPSAWSVNRSEYKAWTGQWTLVSKGTTWDRKIVTTPTFRYGVSDNPPLDTAVPSIPTALGNRAEVEAKQKLKRQNVNYAVAIAEARKSFGLIGNSLLTLAEAYAQARRGKWKGAASTLGVSIKPSGYRGGGRPKTGHYDPYRTGALDHNGREFSNRWLELQYGWYPLLSDIHGAAEDIRSGILHEKWRCDVKRVVLVRMPKEERKTLKTWLVRYKYKNSYMGCKVRLDYTLSSDAMTAGAHTGLTNPALVAWELVPFSFVVDWALPLGNLIDSWDADLGLTFAGGSKTYFQRIEREGIMQASTDNNKIVDMVDSWSYFSMARSIYNETPTSVPYLKNPVSVGHVANALALLVGTLKYK